MKLNRYLATLAAALAISASTSALAHGGERDAYRGHDAHHVSDRRYDNHRTGRFEHRFDRRQHRQVERIHAGRHDGDLTRNEARRLYSYQHRIDRMQDRYGRDGRITHGERRRLNEAQARADRAITRALRDDDHGRDRHRDGDGRRDQVSVVMRLRD